MKVHYRKKAFNGKFKSGDKVRLDMHSLAAGTSLAFKMMGTSISGITDFLYENGLVESGIYEVASCTTDARLPHHKNKFVILKDDRYRGHHMYPDDLFTLVHASGDIHTYSGQTTMTTTTSTTTMLGYQPQSMPYQAQPGDPGYSLFKDSAFQAERWHIKFWVMIVWGVYQAALGVIKAWKWIYAGFKRSDVWLYKLGGQVQRGIGVKRKRRFDWRKGRK